MTEYIAPKGKLAPKHLSIVLFQTKERLDTQMDSAILGAALCDLLIAKGVITEEELDKECARLNKELSE